MTFTIKLRRVNPRIAPFASWSEQMARDNGSDVWTDIANDIYWPEEVTPPGGAFQTWFLAQ